MTFFCSYFKSRRTFCTCLKKILTTFKTHSVYNFVVCRSYTYLCKTISNSEFLPMLVASITKCVDLVCTLLIIIAKVKRWHEIRFKRCYKPRGQNHVPKKALLGFSSSSKEEDLIDGNNYRKSSETFFFSQRSFSECVFIEKKEKLRAHKKIFGFSGSTFSLL